MVGFKQRKYFPQHKSPGNNQRRPGGNRGGPGGGANHGGRNFRQGDYGGGGRFGMGGGGGYNGGAHGHNRFGGGLNAGGHMINPWESGSAHAAGSGGGNFGNFMPYAGGPGEGFSGLGGGGGGGPEMMGSAGYHGHMGNPESKLALNILNAALTSGTPINDGRGRRFDGPPANKMRRMDWGGGYNHQGPGISAPGNQPLRKFPRRDLRFNPRQGAERQAPRRGRPDQHMRNQNLRRRPFNNQGPARRQKKGDMAQSAPAGTSSPEKVDKPVPKQKSEPQKTDEEAEEETADGQTSEEKENDEQQSPVKGSDAEDGEKDPRKKDIAKFCAPVEALKCHMCNFTQFNSHKVFRRHLESINHEKMEQIFHIKGAAILHFLRSQSKLAAQRNIVKSRKMGTTGWITMCSKCQCPIRGGLTAHRKTREHYLVSNYTKCVSCHIKFDTRIDLEKHRLTYPHLRMQLKVEQQRLQKAEKFKKMQEERKKAEDMSLPELDSTKSANDAIEELKISYNHTKVWKKNYIPIFDPAVPIALNFIQKKQQYFCRVCPKKIVHTAKEAHEHFRSQKHHEHYSAYLQRLEKNKELGISEEEDDKQIDVIEDDDKDFEAPEMKSEPEAKQGNGELDEDISFEDMNNMKVIDEVLEESNAEAKADASKTTAAVADDEGQEAEGEKDDESNAEKGADASESTAETDIKKEKNDDELAESGGMSTLLEEIGEDVADIADEKNATGTDGNANEGTAVEEAEEETKPVVAEKAEEEDRPKRTVTLRSTRRGRGQGRGRSAKD